MLHLGSSRAPRYQALSVVIAYESRRAASLSGGMLLAGWNLEKDVAHSGAVLCGTVWRSVICESVWHMSFF